MHRSCDTLQMVERLDQGADLGPNTAPTYPALHALVAKALFRTHVEGKLKVSMKAAPELAVTNIVSCPPRTLGMCTLAGGDHPGPSQVRGEGSRHGPHAAGPARGGEHCLDLWSTSCWQWQMRCTVMAQNMNYASVLCMQGKILMLITNSDFAYTDKMMSYAYDEYLPEGKTWRDLFDMVQLCMTPSHGYLCM